MLHKVRLSTGALALAAASAGAQVTNVAPRTFNLDRNDSPRAVIGVSTSGSASARDTLGLLVTSITPKSPAEKAGLEEGNRIASVNGTNLRLSAGDVDDWEMQGIMQRRLTRELSKLKPGDDVELRVWANGQYKTVHVKTVDSDDLYPSRNVLTARTRMDDRPTLGLGVGSTGSRRDTLGVFVMFVSDSGPAGRAGIVEGDRVASINGVDLRVARLDAGDPEVSGIKARRLEREISGLKPGDDADLRVWSDGQYRNVKVKVGRASDLPRRRNSMFIIGGMDGMVPPMPPMPPMPAMPDVELRLSPDMINLQTRRTIERAMEAAQRAMESSQRAIERAGRAWQDERGFRWDDDESDDPDTPAPAIAPAPSRAPTNRTPAPSRARSSSATTAALAPSATWTNVGFATTATPALAASTIEGRVTARPAVAWSSADDDDATIEIDGLRLAPVNSELAAYLGKGTERGALVVDAPAWIPELHSGDVILTIDGRPVQRDGGLSIAIDRSHASTIAFLRDGKTHVTTAKR